MVKDYKNGKITAEEYTKQYHSLMRKSYTANKADWEEMIRDGAERKGLVFACFCRKGDFCHRHLLKEYISAVAKKMGYTVVIHEE